MSVRSSVNISSGLIVNLKVNLPLELNFVNEGGNAEKLAVLFKNYPWLKVKQG